ncbi:MAG: hypothetical protein AAB706_02940 [Patescibacteria group bacterium]
MISYLFLAWALFFSVFMHILYKSEIKAEELTSLSLNPEGVKVVPQQKN